MSAQSLTLVRHKHIVALISALLWVQFPTAITGAVPKIVVDPSNSEELGRAISHISVEIRKSSPFITDGNPTASVIIPCFIVRIGCPLKHIRPDGVFGTSLPSAAKAMDNPCPLKLLPVASAGRCFPAFQISILDNHLSTAGAFAIPVGYPAIPSSKTDDSPSLEGLPSKVILWLARFIGVQYVFFSSWHGDYMLSVSSGEVVVGLVTALPLHISNDGVKYYL